MLRVYFGKLVTRHELQELLIYLGHRCTLSVTYLHYQCLWYIQYPDNVVSSYEFTEEALWVSEGTQIR